MKILVVTQYFWPEEFKINDLCKALVDRGHEVTVYTGLPNYPQGKFYQNYGFYGPYREVYGKIKIIRTPLIPRGSKKGLRLVINYISYFVIATILAPVLVREKFDIIFAYQLSPIFSVIPAIVLKWIKRIPLFMWVTDLWPESLEATNSVKNKNIISAVGLVVKWIYKHNDRILISSPGFKDKVITMGVPQNKIFYWPQWAELVKEHVIKEYEDKNYPAGFTVLFAGNIGSAQDFPTIIESAKLTKNQRNIKYVILGDGLMKKWAEAEVQKYELTDTFIFLGRKPVETMPFYFSKASVLLVSLTDAEIFGLTVPSKVQSYLASGKPLIGSLNGEGASIINNWQAGIAVDACRPDLLSKAIVKMSELSELQLKIMGENSYKCYINEFEREKLITLFETHLKELKLCI